MSPFFSIDDHLTLPNKYISSTENTQIAEVTNKNMNQDMSDDSSTSQVQIDLPKNYTRKGTAAAACRELLDEINSLNYMIYNSDALLTLKQENHNSREEWVDELKVGKIQEDRHFESIHKPEGQRKLTY